MITCAFLGVLLLAAPAAPAPVAVIPFTDNGKLVYLPVSVGGAPARQFTLDSGASASVIDSGAAAALRMRASGSKLGSGAGAGRVRFALYRNVALAAGGARWTAPTVYGVSLRGVGTAQQEDGLLGYDLFARYVVEVDYAAHRLSLYEPSTFRYAGRGAALPIVITKRVPHLDVTIKVQGRAAQVRRLLIDSGSEDQVDDAVIATSTAPKQRIATSGLGRSVAAYAGPVEWIRIGPFTVRNLAGTSGGVPLMGSAVLRNFHVTFDYSRRRIYLAPR
jgi:Aspartyl protease